MTGEWRIARAEKDAATTALSYQWRSGYASRTVWKRDYLFRRLPGNIPESSGDASGHDRSSVWLPLCHETAENHGAARSYSLSCTNMEVFVKIQKEIHPQKYYVDYLLRGHYTHRGRWTEVSNPWVLRQTDYLAAIWRLWFYISIYCDFFAGGEIEARRNLFQKRQINEPGHALC